MSKIIAEMATGSKELGICLISVLCMGATAFAWVLSGNVLIVLVAVFLTQHICRAVGRASVKVQRDKTARIHGGGWAG